MHPINGDFAVSPSEKITVTVQKSIAPYAADISDVTNSTWDTIQKPDNRTEIRVFRAPNQKDEEARFGVLFDFPPDASGGYEPTDKYTVELKGESGLPVTETVFPPPPAHNVYIFVVE